MEIDTPAFRLLCACCRWPSSESKNTAIAEAAAQGVDWALFRNLVKKHRVAGLAYNALGTALVPVPEEFSLWLTAEARSVGHKALTQLHETIRLQRLLLAGGVETLVLKGAGLGLKVYGSVALKQSIDIDLVMHPEHVRTALQIVQDEGYKLVLPFSPISSAQMPAVLRYLKEIGLRSKSGHFVDIHWTFVDNPGLLNEAMIDWKGTPLPIGNATTLRTLRDDDLFAYLCGHGATHHWARLKWLADLNALLAQSNPETVTTFNARAAALGTLWPAVQAQMLCQKLLGTPLADTLREYAPSRRAQCLLDYALHKVHLTKNTVKVGPFLAARENFILAQLGTSWRFWRGHLKAYLVQPTVIEELHLPGRLIFLYPYIRPFFWLWFRWLSPRGRYRWNGKSVDTTT